jgi:hypothetical protein
VPCDNTFRCTRKNPSRSRSGKRSSCEGALSRAAHDCGSWNTAWIASNDANSFSVGSAYAVRTDQSLRGQYSKTHNGLHTGIEPAVYISILMLPTCVGVRRDIASNDANSFSVGSAYAVRTDQSLRGRPLIGLPRRRFRCTRKNPSRSRSGKRSSCEGALSRAAHEETGQYRRRVRSQCASHCGSWNTAWIASNDANSFSVGSGSDVREKIRAAPDPENGAPARAPYQGPPTKRLVSSIPVCKPLWVLEYCLDSVERR